MNRPDGSLSFLLTLSKTLFLNREHDLFLKKKNLFITSQQTGMTILKGFVFICFQITKIFFSLDLIPFLSRTFTSLWFADGAKKKHLVLQLVSVLDPTFDCT